MLKQTKLLFLLSVLTLSTMARERPIITTFTEKTAITMDLPDGGGEVMVYCEDSSKETISPMEVSFSDSIRVTFLIQETGRCVALAVKTTQWTQTAPHKRYVEWWVFFGVCLGCLILVCVLWFVKSVPAGW